MTAAIETKPNQYEKLLRKPKQFTPLGDGASGTVYRIAKGIVVKIGRIWNDEVEKQEYFHSQGVAVPVLYHGVLHEVGRVHNTHCFLRHKPEEVGTRCAYGIGVLVMPEAEELPWDQEFTPDTDSFMDYIENLMWERFGAEWDRAPRHVRIYEGHKVAIDFGYWS